MPSLALIFEEDSGQSIVELVLVLPLLFGLAMITIRVNSAIQESIVNQKYSRAQALFVSHNSPYYPKKELQGFMVSRGANIAVLGVSDNLMEGSETRPQATVQMVARNSRAAGSRDLPQGEFSEQSGFVRIFNNVALCTPSWVFQGASGKVPIGNLATSSVSDPKAFIFCENPYAATGGGAP